MMDFNKKIEIIRKASKQMGKEIDMLKAAADDVKTQKKALLKVLLINLPVIEMYTDALNEAVNPVNDMTIPIVILLLRQMANGISKRNPAAAEVAKGLETLIPNDTMEIRLKYDAVKKQKEGEE